MNRRRFLARAAWAWLLAKTGRDAAMAVETPPTGARPEPNGQHAPAATLFLCGDVMAGRGIDQILPHPAPPRLFEAYARSALDYVALAERATGPIRHPEDFAYIWGDALAELGRVRPDARIANLETAVTVSGNAWPGKGIHYRMSPANLPCLEAAKIDCCVLSNNHVIDWGRQGLLDTLDNLHKAGIRTAGAGRDEAEATAPAVVELPGQGRVLVFAFGLADSGVPPEWAATGSRPGVNFLEDLSAASVEAVARRVRAAKRAGDLALASLHWGGNWGFAVPRAQRDFAHGLIEEAGIDLVHGHSSHHVKGIEVHRGKLVLYGCGDFLNDYEGIGGEEEYRGDLALMYFPTLDRATGRLLRLALVPTQIRHFRVNRAAEEGRRWLFETLNREGKTFGTRAEQAENGSFLLRWG